MHLWGELQALKRCDSALCLAVTAGNKTNVRFPFLKKLWGANWIQATYSDFGDMKFCTAGADFKGTGGDFIST